MRARPLARQPTLIAIRRTVRAADMLPAPAAARSRRWPPTRMANRPLAQLIPPRRIPMLRARRRRPAGMCHARATVARCRAAARRATAHRQAATEQTALRRHPAAPTADRRRTTAACPVTAPALRRPTTMPHGRELWRRRVDKLRWRRFELRIKHDELRHGAANYGSGGAASYGAGTPSGYNGGGASSYGGAAPAASSAPAVGTSGMNSMPAQHIVNRRGQSLRHFRHVRSTGGRGCRLARLHARLRDFVFAAGGQLVYSGGRFLL